MSHHLRCHCGAVQADADVSLDGAMTCNCSICGRTGAIMVFLPADKLTNIVGEELLTDYQFGKKQIHHAFCSVCGCRPFARGQGEDGRTWAMVNLRCVDALDAHAIEIARRYDGRSM